MHSNNVYVHVSFLSKQVLHILSIYKKPNAKKAARYYIFKPLEKKASVCILSENNINNISESQNCKIDVQQSC